MKVALQAGNPSVASFSFYYGPSDFHVLKKYGMKFEKLVNLGQGPYQFVRPINRYLIIPIFDLFNKMVHNPAIAIVLLTLVIRLFNISTHLYQLSQRRQDESASPRDRQAER